MSDTPIKILLVEDNDRDVRLTQEIFKDAGLTNELVVARDGEEALTMLGLDSEHPEAVLSPTTLPDLIAIDLNLPRLDGRELIEVLKRHVVLKDIPLIILTNSLDDRYLTVSHMLQAKAYIEKPLDVTTLVDALQTYDDRFGFVITRRGGKTKRA